MDLAKKLQQSERSLISTQLEASPLQEPINYKTSSLSLSEKLTSLVKGPERLWSTTLLAITAALLAVVGGYTIAYPSSSLEDLQNITDKRAIKNGSIFEDVYGAITPIGALFGGMVAGSLADILGRRPTIIIALLPYFVGWTMLGISWYIKNVLAFKVVILAGRFISGFGLGWAMLIGPVYIGEISLPSLRGLYSSFPQLFLMIGIMMSYLLGATGLKYHYLAFIASGFTLVISLAIVWVPETPRFHVAKGNAPKALKTLQFLRGHNVDPKEELIEIEEAITTQEKLSCLEVLKELPKRSVYLPFMLVMLLMFFQQFSGINALVFYSAPILQSAGFGSNSAFLALMTVGITSLLATFLNTLIVDLFGRKLLLMTSATLMAFSSYGLGLVMQETALKSVAIVSVIVFQAGFCIGYGATPWIMLPELIPLRVRGLLGGVIAAFNWGCASLITGFYFVISNKIGANIAWWIFAGINGLSIGFVAFFLPETKGKKLEMTEKLFTKNYKFCT